MRSAFVVQEGGTAYHHYRVADDRRFLAFEVAYTNRAIGDALKRSITVELIDGPLQHLHAVWSFEPRDENHTACIFQ